MIDIIDVAISSLITGLSVFISGYVMFKIGKNSIKKELFDFIQSEKGSKLFYQIGVVVAAGAKSGFGLTQKTVRFKIEDLIGQAIGGFIQSKIPIFQPQQQQQQQQQEQPQTQW